ncbi:2-hydroxyacyl-CoA dehydratase family protein [Thermodesulfobacteriota bacterium]
MKKQAFDDKVVGLTTTIPVEIVLAADLKPVDLNNVFINSERPEQLLRQAESIGFSHNSCAWIKGIYSTVIEHGVKNVIAVTGGDCSNTVALSELLVERGVNIINFDYPLNRDRDLLHAQMEKLRKGFSATWDSVKSTKSRLDRIREKLKELDRLTFEGNVVSGFENHLFLVTSSDFKSDPVVYETELDEFLRQAKKRSPVTRKIRLGYLGVPPIFGDFYDTVESLDARVVFNEVQRQFSMPYEENDIIELYSRYTYPYGIEGRVRDIMRAISERHLDGLIHYTQTFCYRQIYDIILRERLPLPILTLEGDRPGPLDGRTTLRIETFIEMLKNRKAEED